MSKYYKLTRSISRNRDLEPNDIKFIKIALNKIGLYDLPNHGITPYSDSALFSGIESFQKTYGLTVDGNMKPGGETETILAAKSPVYRCKTCGAPHGGSKGKDICPNCDAKK